MTATKGTEGNSNKKKPLNPITIVWYTHYIPATLQNNLEVFICRICFSNSAITSLIVNVYIRVMQ